MGEYSLTNSKFVFSKIKHKYNAGKLFKHFLKEIESKNVDYFKYFTLLEIADIIPFKLSGIKSSSTYNYSFMSMFSSQNNRDYFIFEEINLKDVFTGICNNIKRNNLIWKKEYSNKRVKINPKYINIRMVNYDIAISQEVQTSQTYIEGAIKSINVNAYERNREARTKCIEIYGYECSVCEVKLEDIYGELASEFIHVHHLKLLSELKIEYEVDPINDLRPVCPNCHAILHRIIPPLSIEELKKIIYEVASK